MTDVYQLLKKGVLLIPKGVAMYENEWCVYINIYYLK